MATAKPAVSSAEAEGYELGSNEKVEGSTAAVDVGSASTIDAELLKKKDALKADWESWKTQSLINAYVFRLSIIKI